MKVVLLDDVEKLGKLGDIVNVKPGYARNYLFPRKIAIEATDKSLQVLEHRKRKRAEALARMKADMEALAEKIKSTSCTVEAAAGEEDKLFGSVTSEHIAEALAAEGITVDKKQIHIEEPIRKLGVYQVHIKLSPEVSATTKVWVIKK